MPRGYRCVILAVVGWLTLCGAQPPKEQAQSRDSAAKATPTAQTPSSPAQFLAIDKGDNFTAYSGYNPDPCYKAKNHDAADLCAQWRAAIAAEKAAHEARRAGNWSIVATLLNAGGLIAVVVALLLTRSANRLSQREFLAVYGPKVTVGNIHAWNEGCGSLLSPDCLPLKFAAGEEISIAVVASNVGSADAHIIQAECYACWAAGISMIKPNWLKRGQSKLKGIIWNDSPRLDDSHSLKAIKPAHAAAWQWKETVRDGVLFDLYVMGMLRYQDRLGNEFISEFAHRFDRKHGRFVPVQVPA